MNKVEFPGVSSEREGIIEYSGDEEKKEDEDQIKGAN